MSVSCKVKKAMRRRKYDAVEILKNTERSCHYSEVMSVKLKETGNCDDISHDEKYI